MRDWFLNASIALLCGVGLAIALNSGNPLLIGAQTGLAALIGAMAVAVIDRQRKRQVQQRWQVKLGQLQTAVHRLQRQLNSHTEQKDRLVLQIAGYHRQIEALESARTRITKETDRLESQRQELQTEKNALQLSFDRTVIYHRQLQDGQAELHAHLGTQTESQQSLQESLERIRTEEEQLQQRVGQLHSEQRDLDQSLGHRQNQLAALQAQEEQLQQHLLHLQTQATERAIVQTQVAELHQERQQLEQSIDWLKTDLEQMIDRSQSESQAFQEREAELQATIADLERQATSYGDLQAKLAELYQEWQQTEDQVAQLREAATQHQTQLQQAQDERQNLLAAIAQLTEQRQSYQGELATLGPTVQSLTQSSQQLAQEVEALAAKRAQMQLELVELHRQGQLQQQLLASQRELQAADWDEAIPQIESLSGDLSASVTLPTALTGVPAPRATLPEPSPVASFWPDRFEDDNIRAVFVHLDRYGSLTEAELTQMLGGNPRRARQFALNFDAYLSLVPFSARVEVAASGKRYVRD